MTCGGDGASGVLLCSVAWTSACWVNGCGIGASRHVSRHRGPLPHPERGTWRAACRATPLRPGAWHGCRTSPRPFRSTLRVWRVVDSSLGVGGRVRRAAPRALSGSSQPNWPSPTCVTRRLPSRIHAAASLRKGAGRPSTVAVRLVRDAGAAHLRVRDLEARSPRMPTRCDWQRCARGRHHRLFVHGAQTDPRQHMGGDTPSGAPRNGTGGRRRRRRRRGESVSRAISRLRGAVVWKRLCSTTLPPPLSRHRPSAAPSDPASPQATSTVRRSPRGSSDGPGGDPRGRLCLPPWSQRVRDGSARGANVAELSACGRDQVGPTGQRGPSV